MARSIRIASLAVALSLVAGCHVFAPHRNSNSHTPEEVERLPLWQRVEASGGARVQSHSGEVLALKEVAKEPVQLLTAGADGNIVAWTLPNGSASQLRSLGGPIQLAAFGEKHSLVAWATGFTVHVACLEGCSKRWQLDELKTRTTSLAFHEDDSALLIGGTDGRVYRWRFTTVDTAESTREREKILERYIAHQTMVSSVASLPTGRAFFSSDWDGMLYGWLAYTADDQQGEYDRNLFGGRFFGNIGTYLRASRLPDRGITALSVSADGTRLAVGADDGFIEVWEVRGFEMIARTQAHTGRVTGISLNNNGTRVASVARDSHIVAYEITPDSLYKIKPGAMAATLSPILNDEMKSVKGAYFLSSGDLIVTTTSGELGEVALRVKTAAPSPTRIPSSQQKAHASDSDY
jgi:WD40 repeat protein